MWCAKIFLIIPCVFLLIACSADNGDKIDPAVVERVDRFMGRAETSLDEGRTEEALHWANRALAYDPSCLDAVLMRSDCLVRLIRTEEAFDLLLDFPPDSSPFWRKTCLCQAAGFSVRLGQPSPAILYLNRALAEYPDDSELYARRGVAQAASGREQAAVESFQKALDLGEEKERILPPYAEVLYGLEEFEKAESLLEKELSVDHLKPKDKILLGAIKCKLRKREEGLQLFRDAAAQNADLPEAHYNQGRVLEALEDLNGAELAYRQTLRINPDHSPASFHLGCLLLREGRKEEGLDLVNAAIESETDPVVKRALEDTLNRMVKTDGS